MLAGAELSPAAQQLFDRVSRNQASGSSGGGGGGGGGMSSPGGGLGAMMSMMAMMGGGGSGSGRRLAPTTPAPSMEPAPAEEARPLPPPMASLAGRGTGRRPPGKVPASATDVERMLAAMEARLTAHIDARMADLSRKLDARVEAYVAERAELAGGAGDRPGAGGDGDDDEGVADRPLPPPPAVTATEGLGRIEGIPPSALAEDVD